MHLEIRAIVFLIADDSYNSRGSHGYVTIVYTNLVFMYMRESLASLLSLQAHGYRLSISLVNRRSTSAFSLFS